MLSLHWSKCVAFLCRRCLQMERFIFCLNKNSWRFAMWGRNMQLHSQSISVYFQSIDVIIRSVGLVFINPFFHVITKVLSEISCWSLLWLSSLKSRVIVNFESLFFSVIIFPFAIWASTTFLVFYPTGFRTGLYKPEFWTQLIWLILR
jgi:hypothetical protein